MSLKKPTFDPNPKDVPNLLIAFPFQSINSSFTIKDSQTPVPVLINCTGKLIPTGSGFKWVVRESLIRMFCALEVLYH